MRIPPALILDSDMQLINNQLIDQPPLTNAESLNSLSSNSRGFFLIECVNYQYVDNLFNFDANYELFQFLLTIKHKMLRVMVNLPQGDLVQVERFKRYFQSKDQIAFMRMNLMKI